MPVEPDIPPGMTVEEENIYRQAYADQMAKMGGNALPQEQSAAPARSPLPFGGFLNDSALGQATIGQIPPESQTEMRELAAAAIPMATSGAAALASGGQPGAIGFANATGEGINQLIGLRDPSATQIGMAAVAPYMFGKAIDMGKSLIRQLPSVPEHLHQIAKTYVVDNIKNIVRHMGGNSSAFFKLANQYDDFSQAVGSGPIKINTSNIRSMAQSVIDAENKIIDTGARNPSVIKFAQGVLEDIKQDGIALKDYNSLRSRWGSLRKFEASKDTALPEFYKKMYRAAADDLDVSMHSVTPGASVAANVLKEGWQAAKIENTADDLVDLALKDIKDVQGGAEFVKVSGASLINKLQNKGTEIGKRFAGLPKEMQSEIIDVLKPLKELPSLPPPTNTNVGSKLLNMRTAAGGGFAGGIAGLLTHDPVIAGSIGMLGAGAAAVGPEMMRPILSQAIQTGPGRALLKTLIIEGKGQLTRSSLSLLGAFAENQRRDGEALESLLQGAQQ